jgi:glycosyltransferase involved in cell wall biosynthesis
MIGNKAAHPTALAIHLRDDGFMDGCNQYRFRIPFQELRERVPGGTFDWASIGTVRKWAKDPRMPVKPADYDIWVMARFRPIPYDAGHVFETPLRERAEEALGVQLEGQSHIIDLMRVMKPVVSMVLEYDDDYWSGSRNLNYEYTDLLIQAMREADAMTVSTPYLQRLAQKYAPGQRVYMLPNCVKWSEWNDRERWDLWPEDHVVIALTGSRTHYHDWRVLETVLPRIMKERGNVVYLGAGLLPDYLEHLRDLYPDRFWYKDLAEYIDYPDLIRQADIVLCPVIPDDPFNLSKSAIKAIEAQAAARVLPDGERGGAVPITSSTYYYNRVTGGGRRGLTVQHAPEEWYHAITELIDNQPLRLRLAKKGHGWCRANHSIEQQWPLWWDAFRDIHRRKRK